MIFFCKLYFKAIYSMQAIALCLKKLGFCLIHVYLWVNFTGRIAHHSRLGKGGIVEVVGVVMVVVVDVTDVTGKSTGALSASSGS